ncbi:MAG: hypothetical protein ACW986_08615 [Promethearchaeota archaeon]
MVSPEVLGTGLAVYITISVIFVILTFFTYRKYQDKNFISGLVFSGVLNSLPLLAVPYLYFLLGYFLGGLFGFVAGYFSIKFKLGIISGALGILFSFILFGLISPLGFLVFYSLNYILVAITPSILCGAIGGAIGSKIRMKSEIDNNSDSKEEV